MIDTSLPTPFFRPQDRPKRSWHAEGGSLGRRKIAEAPNRKEVDFNRFEMLYYNHFDQRLIGIVDAATVRRPPL
jgi:hypothetical protein